MYRTYDMYLSQQLLFFSIWRKLNIAEKMYREVLYSYCSADMSYDFYMIVSSYSTKIYFISGDLTAWALVAQSVES